MAALWLLVASILIAAATAANQPVGPERVAEPQRRSQGPQNLSGVRVKRAPFSIPGFALPGPPGLSGHYPAQGPPGLAPCQPCIRPCEILRNCKCVIDLQCATNVTRQLLPSLSAFSGSSADGAPIIPADIAALIPGDAAALIPAGAAPITPAAPETTATARVQPLPCPQQCQKLGENGVCVEDFNCPFQADHDATSHATSTGPPHNVSETWDSTPQHNIADRLQKVIIPYLLLSVGLLVAWQ